MPPPLSKSTNPQNLTYKPTLSIIIPCYNEEKTILSVIDSLNELSLPQYELRIYVFDNNSSDSSAALVASKSKSQQNLNLHFVKTQGKGAVLREAFSIINSDIFVIIDADTQHDSSFLPSALNYFNKNSLDMLNIARLPEYANVHRKYHSFGNALFTKSASLLFKRDLKDMLSGYRIFSKAFVKSFPAVSNGFEIETELSIFAAQQNLRFDEIFAPYKARPQGSFSKLSTFKDGFKILKMLLSLLVSERPMLVFGILALICFIVGLILSVPILSEFILTSKVPRFPTLFGIVGLFVISVVLFITGILCSFITRAIKENRRFFYLLHKLDSKQVAESAPPSYTEQNIDSSCHTERKRSI